VDWHPAVVEEIIKADVEQGEKRFATLLKEIKSASTVSVLLILNSYSFFAAQSELSDL